MASEEDISVKGARIAVKCFQAMADGEDLPLPKEEVPLLYRALAAMTFTLGRGVIEAREKVAGKARLN